MSKAPFLRESCSHMSRSSTKRLQISAKDNCRTTIRRDLESSKDVGTAQSYCGIQLKPKSRFDLGIESISDSTARRSSTLLFSGFYLSFQPHLSFDNVVPMSSPTNPSEQVFKASQCRNKTLSECSTKDFYSFSCSAYYRKKSSILSRAFPSNEAVAIESSPAKSKPMALQLLLNYLKKAFED